MDSNRRNFIKQAGLATAGIGLASTLPLHGSVGKQSAADKINVALVGCRNMGFGILKHH